MQRNPSLLSRRDCRYSVSKSKSKSISARVRIQVEDGPCEVTARVLDLSSQGAKLELSEPLLEKQPVEIQLVPNGLDMVITLTGTTCWIRPMRDQFWWLGVSFDDAIEKDVMSLLAKKGILDRRQDERAVVDHGIVARCELSEAPILMKLRNFAGGGIGVWSPRELVPQSRLLFAIAEDDLDAHPIVARVQWVSPMDEGFNAGCSFVAKEGYPELRRQLEARTSDRRESTNRPSLRYVLGLAAAVLGTLLGLHFLARL